MSGLDNLSSLARANSEADLQLRLCSPDLWRRLELHRLAVVSSSTSREAEKARKLALGLLKDVEPRLLFVAVDFCYGPAGDEAKQRAVDVALTSVLGSSVGPELLHESNAELVPFFLAGLCHPAAGVKKLTAKALLTLGLGNGDGGGGRVQHGGEGGGGGAERCRALLQPPVLPALVAALGDGDTGTAQAVADTLASLCQEADRPQAAAAAAATSASGGETQGSCRRAVMAALASQLEEVVAGLTARQASTPKLRFADTAARLMSASDSAFQDALDVGALSLVTGLTEDASDVLLQLNALELLEQVASTPSGARHLVAQGHLDKLLIASGGGEGDNPEAPDPLLGTSALRTLAKVLAKAEGVVGLDVWRERSSSFLGGFIRACAAHLEGRDEAGKLAGLVAASTAAEASNEALKAMLSQEHGTEGALLDAWLTLSGHKVEVKAAALHAVALVLGAPKTSASTPAAAASTTSAAAGGGGGGHTDEDGDEVMGNAAAADGAWREERGSLCKMLFGRLGVCNNKSAAGALLLELARQPVPEIRHAAYDVLRCTVWQPGGWGLSAMFTQPGFRVFLEDRDTAASKATKEWKFSVVESIMGCKERAVLGQEVLESLRNVLKEGPFFVPAKTRNVATAE